MMVRRWLERSGRSTMRYRLIARGAALAALAAWFCFLSAEAVPPRETVTPAFREVIQNLPGKSLIGVVVNYPPGGATPAHHHARSAFITAYVLSGSIRRQIDNGEVQVFRAGESWTEAPGAHHQISENASATEPASLLAIFVVDTNDSAELTTLDRQ
jgi:quercetin dioxygenase-like cupin family protein